MYAAPKDFPGWFAVDFGTSNSTVTLFDNRRVPAPNTLPKEQEQLLGQRLAQWLNLPAAEALAGASASEWGSFVSEICQDLGIAEPSKLGDIFSQTAGLLEAIRKLELNLSNRNEAFRRGASKRLNRIYHEVFRVPPMDWQNLYPVELNLSRRDTEIPSELEIVSLENPLKLNMGEIVGQHRKDALKQGIDINNRFHHSPKRYFGDTQRKWSVTLDGQEKTITVSDLVKAAWNKLLQLTEEFRKKYPDRFAEGRFDRAVVTYPTKASPAVRSDIYKLFKELGISQVQTAYDEAVSVAIFFLWREFGGDFNVGIESFKTRCRRNGDKWSQNVLVLDIGGGTTDIALLSLTLQQKDPFQPNEDRGAGGRYYVLTPKLLRSSGHSQLGGELITLRIFRLLKAAIADCILTAVELGGLESQMLKDRISELSERFRNNDNKFQTGTLLACLDRENPEGDSTAYTDALNAAEKVLPTRWEKYPELLQPFYTLWEHSETAKLELAKNQGDSYPPPFVLPEKEISDLLRQSGIIFTVNDANSLRVELNRQQFERAVIPVIREAIGIAKGLVSSQLENNKETVGWLILSGKTCNIYLVRDEIRKEFSSYEYFVWNPERVTFVPEFTKLATSAGACYAEKMLQYGFNLEESKRFLREGANQLDIDVKNLFYFLPCSFKLKTQSSELLLPIFKAGQQLYQLDVASSEPLAKVRSGWREGVQLMSTVYRQDYENGDFMFWGNFNGNKLAQQLGMTEYEFRNQIKVQFEIDHKLQFRLLLCKGNPHYWIAADVPSLDVAKVIGTQPVIADGKLICDIALHVIEGATAHKVGAEFVVFEAGDYSNSLKVFRYEGGAAPNQGSGLLSENKSYGEESVPTLPRNGSHTFYFRQPDQNEWTRIGELKLPSRKTDFPCTYRFSLDAQGILRIHLGEVPYWTSTNPEYLKQEGCVFVADLDTTPNEIDKNRDPFCGIH